MNNNYYKEKARIEILAKKKKEQKMAREYTKSIDKMFKDLKEKEKK
jgi:hypothetical protein